MKKACLISCAIFLLLFLSLPFFYILSPSINSQINDNTTGSVEYAMPYPGILPDHPLYFLKAIRDKIAEYAIRDNMQRANQYLLLSDKRAGMAVVLAKKGKDDLAISTFSKGEKYALKIPPLLRNSKKQGVSYTNGMVDTLKKSNLKHQELIMTLMKQMPQGRSNELKLLLDLNSQVKKQVNSL